MKFIVDAQLPRRLALEIKALGNDAIHTLDLPARNLTSDNDVLLMAASGQRVVVTKDSDFVDSFLMRGEPAKLLHISNDQLIHLMRTNWPAILQMLTQGDYLELDRHSLVLHM